MSGPFDMWVPDRGAWPVWAQNSECMGKHMQSAAVDLILTLITTPSFPHRWTSWRPWPSRKEKLAASTSKKTSGYGKVKVIPWGRKTESSVLVLRRLEERQLPPTVSLCLDSHHLCYWICKEPCLVGTGRCKAKSSSFYSNWYSNGLRAESGFWPSAI